MNKKIVFVGTVAGCLLCGAVVYSQFHSASTPLMPQVEIDARFKKADINGDGVLSKEEFGKYMVVLQRTPVSGKSVKICDETGLPCTHGGSGGGDCCGGKNKGDAATSGSEKKEKEGGCCKEK